MLVWEAHRDLSLGLGDSVILENYSQTTINTLPFPPGIPDGVRFSRAMRDSYLYRAMLEELKLLSNVTAQLPYISRAMFLERTKPNLLYRLEHALPENSNPEFDLPLTGYPGVCMAVSTNIRCLTGDWFPVPIKNPIEYNALLNTRNVQKPDIFCLYIGQGNTINNTLRIIDKQGVLAIGDTIELKYIPYPIHPSTQATNSTNIVTDTLKYIEEADYEQIILRAIMYGQMESQDVDFSQYAAALLQQGGSNAIHQ